MSYKEAYLTLIVTIYWSGVITIRFLIQVFNWLKLGYRKEIYSWPLFTQRRDYTIKIIWTQSVLFKSVGCSGAWPYLICLPLQALLSPALYWIALTTIIFNWNRTDLWGVYKSLPRGWQYIVWIFDLSLFIITWHVMQCNVVTWPCL